jgi:hypothetical protein
MNKSNTTRKVVSKSGGIISWFSNCIFKANHKFSSNLKAVKQHVKRNFKLRVRTAILITKQHPAANEP